MRLSRLFVFCFCVFSDAAKRLVFVFSDVFSDGVEEIGVSARRIRHPRGLGWR